MNEKPSNYELAVGALDAAFCEEPRSAGRAEFTAEATARALLAIADAIRETRAPAAEPTPAPAGEPGGYASFGVAYDLSLTYVGERSGQRYRCGGRTHNGTPLMFDAVECDDEGYPEPYAKAYPLPYIVANEHALTPETGR